MGRRGLRATSQIRSTESNFFPVARVIGVDHECVMIEPEVLLRAYMQGVFPMAVDCGEIGWFSPDPRGVIPLEKFHLPHGVKRFLRNSPFKVRVNTDFEAVMKGCADRAETWIDDTILESYCKLHDIGCAHSVETWRGNELVGGLYGVAIGGAFFGESMFSRESNASSQALVALVKRLRNRKYILLDTQWTTPHLERFGAIEIPRDEYMMLLNKAFVLDCPFE